MLRKLKGKLKPGSSGGSRPQDNPSLAYPPPAPAPALAPAPASAPVRPPTPPVILFRNRGDERSNRGDFNGAVAMYDEALRYAPTDTTLLLSRSCAHMESTPPNLELALLDVDAAVRHGPTNWQAFLQRGETLLRMGNIQSAELAFVNAEMFAQGMDKVVARRSLAAARAQLNNPPRPIGSSAASVPLASSAAPALSTPRAATVQPPPAETLAQPPPSGTSVQLSPSETPASPTSSGTPALSPPLTLAQPTLPSRPSPAHLTSNSSPAPQAQTPQAPLQPEGPSIPQEAPPSYTPPAPINISPVELTTRLTQLETALAVKQKGSVSIRPYTSTGGIDSAQLVYVGMTQFELTARELGTPTYLHPSFRTIAVDAINFPGSTFLDMDCESLGYYDGKLPGTVTISGYSEEYREHQLLIAPLLNFTLEGTSAIPPVPLDKIVERIRLLQRQPALEDNEGLRGILGLSQLSTLTSGFYSAGGRQRQIEVICMGLNRSLYDAPTRFIDFSKARSISNNTLGTTAQGIGLQHFLLQILLGAELLIRLREEPILTSYASLVTNPISALIVLSALWMENVSIQGPIASSTSNATNATHTANSTINIPPSPRYLLVALQHQRQVQGLIRFGEALSWPYMDEARSYIEMAYQDLTSSHPTVNFDICDWLFGLILPGRIFRHRIMNCLVYASVSVRSLGAAPYWDNGLVVKNKSYWPRRTVLGRVLGGLKNPKSVCGWVGPVPIPEGAISGWIKLNARRVDIPVPAKATQSSLQGLGFGQPSPNDTPEDILDSISNPDEWIRGTPPSRPASDTSRSVFKAIRLTEIPSPSVSTAAASLLAAILPPTKEYRAALDFEVNGTPTTYTLFANPVLVCAPPCVGTHVMHRRQAENCLKCVLRVAELKEAYPASDELVIINAMGGGEEVVARAWCAERARNAVVRRGTECCFACAVAMATERKGTGFNVLVWSVGN